MKINKIIIMLSLMMILMVSMVSAGLIDTITMPDAGSQDSFYENDVFTNEWTHTQANFLSNGAYFFDAGSTGSCDTGTAHFTNWIPTSVGNACYHTSIDHAIYPEMDFYVESVIFIQGGMMQFTINDAAPSNTAPVINFMTPSENSYTELRSGMIQLFLADVTDDDGDAAYSWKLDGVEVATTETFLAEYDNIAAGTYTLELTVSDAEFSDSASATLEIRAKGGAATSAPTNNIVLEKINDVDVSNNDIIENQNMFQNMWNWFRGLFK